MKSKNDEENQIYDRYKKTQVGESDINKKVNELLLWAFAVPNRFGKMLMYIVHDNNELAREKEKEYCMAKALPFFILLVDVHKNRIIAMQNHQAIEKILVCVGVLYSNTANGWKN